MPLPAYIDRIGFELAKRWCAGKGSDWTLIGQLGTGGTASVFEVSSHDGLRGLKIYSEAFSSGEQGSIQKKRIDQQIALQGHNCESLVQIYEGGIFEGRLFLLMSRAPGRELETILNEIPREKIRYIVDKVAMAAEFLRSKNLCHRDIKAANIVVSDDFNQVTLLDISVIREIHDPVGIGTDHEGQLPVVATARYSPPEYLFRLIEPGPELWNALTIYQLGALLHDLIMRVPLFQSEYLISKENRYRFAWIVATDRPEIHADDVPQDLVFTARRALDKDWRRRSSLKIHDFFSDVSIQEEHALRALGLNREPATTLVSDNIPARLIRLRLAAEGLETAVLDTLNKQGVKPSHTLDAGGYGNSRILRFTWHPDAPEAGKAAPKIELIVTLGWSDDRSADLFKCSARLSLNFDEQLRTAEMELPALPVSTDADKLLAEQINVALGKLAALAMNASNTN